MQPLVALPDQLVIPPFHAIELAADLILKIHQHFIQNRGLIGRKDSSPGSARPSQVDMRGQPGTTTRLAEELLDATRGLRKLHHREQHNKQALWRKREGPLKAIGHPTT